VTIKDTTAGQGAVRLKQLSGNVNSFTLRRLLVVAQSQFVQMRKNNCGGKLLCFSLCK